MVIVSSLGFRAAILCGAATYLIGWLVFELSLRFAKPALSA
jgi:hypothetical protein